MNNFASKYAAFVVANRKALLAVMAMFTLFMGYFIQDLDIRNDPDTLLPESNRYVATMLTASRNLALVTLWCLASY